MAAAARALDADAGCAAVLQQVAAARGAINGLMDELIEDHLREHLARPDLTLPEMEEPSCSKQCYLAVCDKAQQTVFDTQAVYSWRDDPSFERKTGMTIIEWRAAKRRQQEAQRQKVVQPDRSPAS